MNLSYLLPQ